jgi:hypothetical protein
MVRSSATPAAAVVSAAMSCRGPASHKIVALHHHPRDGGARAVVCAALVVALGAVSLARSPVVTTRPCSIGLFRRVNVTCINVDSTVFCWSRRCTTTCARVVRLPDTAVAVAAGVTRRRASGARTFARLARRRRPSP